MDLTKDYETGWEAGEKGRKMQEMAKEINPHLP